MDTINFTFDLWNQKGVSMELPIEQNRINTSEFLPTSIFTKNAGNSFFAQAFVGMSSGSDPNEVQNDLVYMIQFINYNHIDITKKDVYIDIVTNSIKNHISNYKRIFFTDLCSYIDLAAHMMSINHFTKYDIHKFYVTTIVEAVQEYGDLVKDGDPILGIIPFSSTHKYRSAKELIQEYR